MARKKPDDPPAGDAPPSARDRVDLRIEPAFAARAERQAKRLHLTLAGYIKMALSRQVEADEATDPAL